MKHPMQSHQYTCNISVLAPPPGRRPTRMCGIIGIFKHQGDANVEVYEGLLSLQHRGQDSAGIVTTNWHRFHEHRDNGLVSDVFKDQALIDRLTGMHY